MPDNEANLRVLACGQTSYSVRLDAPITDTSFDNIVFHVDTNDTRMRQTEVTKRNMLCDFARNMYQHRFILSGPLPDRGNEGYGRLLSLNRWLTRYSSEQGFCFIDNWPSLWGRPGILMRDGIHPTG